MWLNSLKNKFARFMYGRYGNDQLSKFMLSCTLVLLIVSMFIRIRVIYWAGLLLLVLTYARILSKNTEKMARQNQKFLEFRYEWALKWQKRRDRANQKKIYRFFNCPYCKQTVRIPKGRGKIVITCPKCKTEFQRRS